MTEFDYRDEANSLRVVAENIMPLYSHVARVPMPLEHMCTRDVLVMEYVPGVKLADGIRTHVRIA
jgi:aarF domain-containing kinase